MEKNVVTTGVEAMGCRNGVPGSHSDITSRVILRGFPKPSCSTMETPLSRRKPAPDAHLRLRSQAEVVQSQHTDCLADQESDKTLPINPRLTMLQLTVEGVLLSRITKFGPQNPFSEKWNMNRLFHGRTTKTYHTGENIEGAIGRRGMGPPQHGESENGPYHLTPLSSYQHLQV